jgi:transcriptional regulator with XRE-family HTH domain
MRAHLKEGTSIPARVVESFMPFITLRDMAHMIDVGRQRRHQLGLSIVEVEDCAGLTADHIAKAETGRPVNIDTAISWLGALGYEIVLRPVDLPAITLRFVAAKRGALSRSARAQWARRSTRPQDEPAGRR